jgi:hypothetical protein
MKKLICIFSLFMLCGCPAYDPPRGFLRIDNDSDEAVYVHFNCGNTDSLPLHPKLQLFLFSSEKMEDAYGNPSKPHFFSPDYRINAYSYSPIFIRGTLSHPHLPCDEKKITLFFITEKTMRTYDWEAIYKNQMFVKKITLTEEELKQNNWVVVYE